jgi:hypothetical protein
MVRRIIRKLTISEISSIDRPAQEHARAVIMKRAPATEGDAPQDYVKPTSHIGPEHARLHSLATDAARATPGLHYSRAVANILTATSASTMALRWEGQPSTSSAASNSLSAVILGVTRSPCQCGTGGGEEYNSALASSARVATSRSVQALNSSVSMPSAAAILAGSACKAHFRNRFKLSRCRLPCHRRAAHGLNPNRENEAIASTLSGFHPVYPQENPRAPLCPHDRRP